MDVASIGNRLARATPVSRIESLIAPKCMFDRSRKDGPSVPDETVASAENGNLASLIWLDFAKAFAAIAALAVGCLLVSFYSAHSDALSAHSAHQWLSRINLLVIVVAGGVALAAIGNAGSSIKGALTMLQTRVADQRIALEHLRGRNETLEERVAERSTAAEQRSLELAHAQNTLYRQTRLLRSLLTSMADAVMVCDKQKKLLEINPLPKESSYVRFGRCHWINGRRISNCSTTPTAS